jgi:ribonuclease BN (tRNA processing enzyme)
VEPFRLESMLLPHYVPNAGVRLAAAGLTVAYTGDTRVNKWFAHAASSPETRNCTRKS